MAWMVDRFVARARRRRAVRLGRLITDIASARGGCRIVDLGGEGAYWGLFGRDALYAQGVCVTLVNPKPEQVDHPIFTVIEADACDLPGLQAASFDPRPFQLHPGARRGVVADEGLRRPAAPARPGLLRPDALCLVSDRAALPGAGLPLDARADAGARHDAAAPWTPRARRRRRRGDGGGALGAAPRSDPVPGPLPPTPSMRPSGSRACQSR